MYYTHRQKCVYITISNHGKKAENFLYMLYFKKYFIYMQIYYQMRKMANITDGVDLIYGKASLQISHKK